MAKAPSRRDRHRIAAQAPTKAQLRAERALDERLCKTWNDYRRAEARRSRRASSRVESHPRWRRAAAWEALKQMVGAQ